MEVSVSSHCKYREVEKIKKIFMVYKYQILSLLAGFHNEIYFDRNNQVLRIYSKFDKIARIVETKFILHPIEKKFENQTFVEYSISK